jgi:hypothetical protein
MNNIMNNPKYKPYLDFLNKVGYDYDMLYDLFHESEDKVSIAFGILTLGELRSWLKNDEGISNKEKKRILDEYKNMLKS